MAVSRAQKQRSDQLFEQGVITAAEHAAELDVELASVADQGPDDGPGAAAARRRHRARADLGHALEQTVSTRWATPSATSSASGGTSLLKMADLSRVRMRAGRSQTDVGNVRPGAERHHHRRRLSPAGLRRRRGGTDRAPGHHPAVADAVPGVDLLRNDRRGPAAARHERRGVDAGRPARGRAAVPVDGTQHPGDRRGGGGVGHERRLGAQPRPARRCSRRRSRRARPATPPTARARNGPGSGMEPGGRGGPGGQGGPSHARGMAAHA